MKYLWEELYEIVWRGTDSQLAALGEEADVSLELQELIDDCIDYGLAY